MTTMTTMTMTMTMIKMVTQLTNAPATVDHNQLLAPAVKISFWNTKITKENQTKDIEIKNTDV